MSKRTLNDKKVECRKVSKDDPLMKKFPLKKFPIKELRGRGFYLAGCFTCYACGNCS